METATDPPTDTPTEPPTDTPAGVPEDVQSPSEVERPSDAVAWTYATGGDVQYPVTVTEDTIYVSSDALYALSPAGNQRWASQAGPTEATPLVYDDLVVTLLSANVDTGRAILAVDKNGREAWRFSADRRVNYLAAGGGQIYASSYGHISASTGHRLYAVDAATGEQRWQAEVGYPTDTVVVDSTVINASERIVRAFDVDDGTKLWEQSVSVGGYEAIEGVLDGAVLLSSARALSVSDGHTRWQHNGQDVFLSDGRVFAAVENRDSWQLAALDPATGREQWRSRRLPSVLEPLTSDGETVVAGYNGGLLAFNAVDGTIRWAWDEPRRTWGAGQVGNVFVARYDRHAFVVTTDGTEWWEYRAPASFSGVVTTDTAAYLGDRSGTVHALTAE